MTGDRSIAIAACYAGDGRLKALKESPDTEVVPDDYLSGWSPLASAMASSMGPIRAAARG